jgi:hypothetical protein
VEGYKEHCVQVVERCAEIIRMAQGVVEDEIAKDYFLDLPLRASHTWAGLPLKTVFSKYRIPQTFWGVFKRCLSFFRAKSQPTTLRRL